MEKQPVVYMMASRPFGVLYVGVTSDLPKRIWQHKQGHIQGFTAQYHVKLLVWYEVHNTVESAISREKQLKAGSRIKKVALITAFNPKWADLTDRL